MSESPRVRSCKQALRTIHGVSYCWQTFQRTFAERFSDEKDVCNVVGITFCPPPKKELNYNSRLIHYFWCVFCCFTVMYLSRGLYLTSSLGPKLTGGCGVFFSTGRCSRISQMFLSWCRPWWGWRGIWKWHWHPDCQQQWVETFTNIQHTYRTCKCTQKEKENIVLFYYRCRL